MEHVVSHHLPNISGSFDYDVFPNFPYMNGGVPFDLKLVNNFSIKQYANENSFSSNNLMDAERIYGDLRPHACPFQDCGKRYKKKSHLKVDFI